MDTTIVDSLKSSISFFEASKLVAEKKPINKLFKKSVEELSELLEKICKRMNGNTSVQDEHIFSEIVDVVIQMHLLSAKFPSFMKKSIVAAKIKQFLNSKTVAKYRNKRNAKM